MDLSTCRLFMGSMVVSRKGRNSTLKTMYKKVRNRGIFIREVEEHGFIRGVSDPFLSVRREYRPWVKMIFWTTVLLWGFSPIIKALSIIFFGKA